MLVLAVGLLGLAGLQAKGMKNNQSAYYRSQATQLAYDIADRMRANVVDAQLYATSTYITLAPTAAAKQKGCTTKPTKPTAKNPCTPAQMAQQDLFEWNQRIVSILPLGQGTIEVKAPIYKITITWDDNRDGNVDATNDPSFETSFQL